MTTLIIGPGQHANEVINKCVQGEKEFQYFRYWPDCRKYIYHDGNLMLEKHYWWYDILRKIVWGVFNKLKLTYGHKRHLDILFSIYDFLISKNLRGTKVLIAWPQVSLFSIQKAKKNGATVTLEYPMIHVNSWMAIMLREYDKWEMPKKKAANLFSAYMIRRMSNEIALSDKIVVLSAYAKQSFIDNSIEKSKVKLRQLCDNNELNYPSETSKSDKIIILFVGRIDLLKGVHYLLMAYTQFKTKNTELWLVGPKSLEIDPFLKKYYDPSIKLLGVLTKPELNQVYKKATVLVLPSVQESFGMVLIEALEYKIPIIASKNSGALDIKNSYPNCTIKTYDPYEVQDLLKLLIKICAQKVK